ncbi:hypothetical protein ACNOYE_27885 [Nannocystaceae bacterium ST9]
MGNWILVGASLLGLLSIAVIAWSLWSGSRARARPPMPTGSFAPLPQPGAYAPTYVAPPPPVESYAPHTVIGPAPGPLEVAPARREETQFLSPDEMFGRPGRSRDSASRDPAGELDEDDENPTQFMSDDDLFGAREVPVDPTVVLREEWIAAPADPVRVEPIRVEPVRVEPMRVEPVQPIPRAPSVAQMRATTPDRPLPAASIPSAPRPKPASKPTPRVDPRLAPPDPAEFAKPVRDEGPTPYAGYVAPRPANAIDDDDDDGDPETELVHQAELLRLMNKGKPQG